MDFIVMDLKISSKRIWNNFEKRKKQYNNNIINMNNNNNNNNNNFISINPNNNFHQIYHQLIIINNNKKIIKKISFLVKMKAYNSKIKFLFRNNWKKYKMLQKKITKKKTVCLIYN